MPGLCCRSSDEFGQIVLELATQLVPASNCSREDRLERAEDRERPLAQRAPFVGYTEQIADELHRDRGGKIIDQVDDA